MKIERAKAKELIATKQAKSISIEDKYSILEGEYWWFENAEGIKEAIEEGEYPRISEHLIQIIHDNPCPTALDNPEIDVLIIDALIHDLSKSTNSYLSIKIQELLNKKYIVIGLQEKAGLCPCCEYYSNEYGEDGYQDICKVCFWQDGGEGPNQMTLEKAQSNFKKMGAISASALSFIDPEGKIKFQKK